MSTVASEARRVITREFMADRHRLLAFIYSLVKDYHVAEDILQEVWVRLDRALCNNASIDEPQKWCRGVAKNLLLQYWRQAKKKKPVTYHEDMVNLIETSFREQDNRQQYWRMREHALRVCLEKLPLHSRQLLQLRYVQGLSISIIAQQQNKTIEAITKALSRLRKLLHECAERCMQVSEELSS